MKLYTIHCPKCRVLETKLKQKNIEYEEISDEKKLLELGLSDMPMLALTGYWDSNQIPSIIVLIIVLISRYCNGKCNHDSYYHEK